MGFPAVTHAALRYGVCPLRRVLLVAIQTAHLGLVLTSVLSYGLSLLGMADLTLSIRQGRGRLHSAFCLRTCG
jgi:hypothetical protein